MAIITLHNVPGFGDIQINTEWPKQILDMWKDVLGQLADSLISTATNPFVPTFESQQFSQLPDSPPVPLAITEFATQATADELAKRFGATVVGIVPPYAVGSPVQDWLVWPDGTAINAGVLAAYYQNSPEDKFPNVAKGQVEKGIADARAAGQKLPT